MDFKGNVTIRDSRPEDAEEIISLIIELADFEKLEPPDEDARNRLINDAFGENPYFRVMIAESDDKAIGYAFYFFTYSSFLAKRTLYLEDIYISNEFRGQGIGKQFMSKLMETASENNCGRMEWVVLDWNTRAIEFYEKLGARELKEWKTYRLPINDM